MSNPRVEPALPKITPHARTMPYPYTFGARFRQFPWRWHFQTNPMFRFMIYSGAIVVTGWWYVQRKMGGSDDFRRTEYLKLKAAWDDLPSHMGMVQKNADHEHFHYHSPRGH